MINSVCIRALFFCLWMGFCSEPSLQAQTVPVKVPAKSVSDFPSGISSDQLQQGTKVLAFIKGPSKRTLYTVGSFVRIKTTEYGKVKGFINRIGDTAVVVSGLVCSYSSIMAYYVPLRLCSIIGSALCVGGVGYVLFDAINGAIRRLDPPFHIEALAVSLPLVVAGGTLLAFTRVKRSTKTWHVKAMDL